MKTYALSDFVSTPVTAVKPGDKIAVARSYYFVATKVVSVHVGNCCLICCSPVPGMILESTDSRIINIDWSGSDLKVEIQECYDLDEKVLILKTNQT